MKKTNKGFTIVELVIVIAVIAILAAVLIPTFTGLIEKANLSKDQQAVANMNKDLAMEDVLNGFEYAGDAVNALAKYGFYGDKFDTFAAGYYYAYDKQQNRMYLLDKDGEPIFPDDKAEKSNLWGLYNNDKSDLIPGITQYVALATIKDAVQFNADDGVLDNTTIDLAGKVITFTTEKTGITLVNGSTTADGYTMGAGATQLTAGTLTSGQSAENAYFTSTGNERCESTAGNEIVYENCVFDISGSFLIQGDDNVTFKNCTFISSNSSQWALTVGGAGQDAYRGTLTVEGCTFESGRGIAIHPGANAENPRIIIKNCEFATRNAEKPAIQVVTVHSTASITISDNTFLSGTAAFMVHVDSNIQDVGADIVTFSNNTLGTGVKTVIGDGNSLHDEIVKALAAKFN